MMAMMARRASMAANGSPAGLVDYQMFINNKWVDAQSGETFESVNPYTGTAWARVPRASGPDVDTAVQAGRTGSRRSTSTPR
jgi:acyl-CoA reductase-like NAD-dependent aldehyde dehydrogenase